ncbi:MAG: hypothetical protein DLM53_00325 [Candidatus Eremiobacter antarcticus]|nr:MAG: hypothetical protein DLM53_00325 [Candidatus Eremiobacter sp. RRmetagenome_bin22]
MHCFHRLLAGFAALALIALLVTSTREGLNSARAADTVRITVEPNILVTQDIDAPHTETSLATDAANPRRLLGAVTTFARTGQGLYDKPQASLDGGYTWADSTVPESREGSGDPQTAYGITGTSYFVTLNNKYGMLFYRSIDGGITWKKPLALGHCDHEQIAIDRTSGPHRGRVYITAEHILPKSRRLQGDRVLELWRSDNDGRSFTSRVLESGHVAADKPFADGGLAAEGLAVLSDGSLVAGVVRYVTERDFPYERFYTTVSRDGGNTFGPERKSVDLNFGGQSKMMDHQLAVQHGDMTRSFSLSVLAADTDKKSPYRDRLYVVYGVISANNSRLDTIYSIDRGRSWSAPVGVVSGAGGGTDFQPAIATNARGEVGILYYHAPADNSNNRFHVYVTVSLDGGKSWLPSARVSSRSSLPHARGNMLPMGFYTQSSKKELSASVISANSRWPEGGDYIGFSADASGVFHALWPDSRTGTYQLYAARVNVAGPPMPSAEGPIQLVNDKLQLIFDPSRYDASAGDFIFPIRLRNVSKGVIYGPLTTTLKGTVDKYIIAEHRKRVPYVIRNAANGQRGPGATFDYTTALGGTGRLSPGALTDAVEWRVHLSDPTRLDTFQFHLDAHGRYSAP